MDIDRLIEENRTNHFRLLTLVGNDSAKEGAVIKHLQKKGWHVYDVEAVVLRLVEGIPEEKVKLRIGLKIKEWSKTIESRSILTNSDLLYSPEMGKIGPFDCFKYLMRGEKEGVLFLHAKLKNGNQAVYSMPGRLDYSEKELDKVLFTDISDVTLEEE